MLHFLPLERQTKQKMFVLNKLQFRQFGIFFHKKKKILKTIRCQNGLWVKWQLIANVLILAALGGFLVSLPRSHIKHEVLLLFLQPFGVNQPGPYVMYTTVDSNGYLKNASGQWSSLSLGC